MKVRSELYWSAGIAVITVVLGTLCFGIKVLSTSIVDFQLHERYFALNGFVALLFLFTVLLSGAVLIRLIYRYSNNKALNILFSLVIIYLVFVAWLYIDELNSFEIYTRELYADGVNSSDQKETFAGIENSRRFLRILMGLGIFLSATSLFKMFFRSNRK